MAGSVRTGVGLAFGLLIGLILLAVGFFVVIPAMCITAVVGTAAMAEKGEDAKESQALARQKELVGSQRTTMKKNEPVNQRAATTSPAAPLTLDVKKTHDSIAYLTNICRDAEPAIIDEIAKKAVGMEVRWEAKVRIPFAGTESKGGTIQLVRGKAFINCDLNFFPADRIVALKKQEEAVVYGRISALKKDANGRLIVQVSTDKLNALIARKSKTTSQPDKSP